MTNRIYLRVPSTKCEPSTPCNRYYFDDGTMVDLNADVRCATCKWWWRWRLAVTEGSYCGHVGIEHDLGPDFACSMWEPRAVTGTLNETQQTGDAPCPMCGGTGWTDGTPVGFRDPEGHTFFPCDCKETE